MRTPRELMRAMKVEAGLEGKNAPTEGDIADEEVHREIGDVC